MVAATRPSTVRGDKVSPSTSQAMSAAAPGTTKNDEAARPAPY